MNMITDKITKFRERIKQDMQELMRLEKAVGIETSFEFQVIR